MRRSRKRRNSRRRTPKFRAVLPPELKGTDLDEGALGEPVDVEEHIASLDARLEALDAPGHE